MTCPRCTGLETDNGRLVQQLAKCIEERDFWHDQAISAAMALATADTTIARLQER